MVALVLMAGCGNPQSAVPSASSYVPGPLGDTWTWDGVAWNQAPRAGPSASYDAAIA